VSAFIDEYLPLSKTETRKSFPVKYCGELAPWRLIKNLPAGPSGLTVTTNREDNLVIIGKDKTQKPWTIRVCGESVGLPYSTYVTDLDRDGTPDLVLICGTGGCGLAPSSHFLCFLFDEMGRPVPFTADGYFDYDEHGIRDLLDINRDGKAELVYMNYDDGYWITSLYEATRGHWQRLGGRFGQRTFPVYTRFSNRNNHTPVIPKAGRHPFAPDLSNAFANVFGSLVEYKWANVEASEDIQFSIIAAGNKQLICKPVSWYSTFSVVLDEPRGRQVVSLAANEKSVRRLLDTIVAERCTVSLFGQRRSNPFTPELLWAQQGQSLPNPSGPQP
jgi:hypothetical protein